jgi:O-6-methylguanine DNA methyltransferase
MASTNDNLFTILIDYAVPRKLGCRILTEWGPVTAHFSVAGVTQLYFDDCAWKTTKADSIFQSTFIKWLAHYQSLTPTKRKKYLAPQGTKFQQSVWRELSKIPLGETVSYQTIAKRIGNPKANRAVGSAVGANPISLLIPCHRVIQASGTVGNYRWGADRKLALLDAEQEAGCDLLRLFK